MQARIQSRFARLLLAGVVCPALLAPAPAFAQTYRGLWVGEATLTRANEVTVPLDANNVPIAPKPAVATPTGDAANLRLILHVNGAGQVTLLKDVAILNRVTGTNGLVTDGAAVVNLLQNGAALDAPENLLQSESDLSLVTDERLYADYPTQPAIRIASAVFDFGDSRATEAVDAVVAAAADLAGGAVNGMPSSRFTTSAGQQSAIAEARAAAVDTAQPGNAQSVVDTADVAADFAQFLIDHFTSADVDAMATAADPAAAPEAQAARAAALALQTNSFYGDTRAVEMIDAVVAAVTNLVNHDPAATNEQKTAVAQNTASAYADVTDNYQRFIAGKLFGDMISAAAAAAATAAVVDGATTNSIQAAINASQTVAAAKTAAVDLRIPRYQDTRATVAVDQVLASMLARAAAFLPAAAGSEDDIETASSAAGRDTLEKTVTRYPLPAAAPTPDYDDFVRSEDFQASAATAAEAAAQGAVFERVNNALYTEQSLKNAAKVEAVKALQNVYAQAARAVRNELPLIGTFGPGQGDPRLTWEIAQNNADPANPPQPPLDPNSGALTGTIYLPANHPTNPFRHRRHPDHTIGFDIQRKIRLDFDAQDGQALPRSGYGVDRITGVYREEIFGLHKPLGPNPDTDPIGLRVEGAFELHRISLIDTLNAR